ncbi:hypothetical protein BCL79_2728 [Stenotrophomonas rhizophila]|uniref:Uncharacterized protein n=1 Tax=Stenotrophomonas rhizophila TaxID=216778 RepID=A0A498CCI4_9GAMM|nr:hypothetical protein [Stenotrophomonas rhizophila]RLK53422.1 hypothetical protein BCL79_2728 [Stenotrophomonas rhizophila]
MELREDPLFMALFGQVQTLDAVLTAVISTHPRPAELLAAIEEEIARARSVSGTNSALNPVGQLAHQKLVEKSEAWLKYCRQVLR